MAGERFDPAAYVAALKEERATVARQPYAPEREHVQARRLKEIDAEIKKYESAASTSPRGV